MPTELRLNDVPSPAATPPDAAGAPTVPGAAEKLDAVVESVPYKTWLTAIVLLAVLLQAVLVVTSPPIAPDGVTFLNMARALPNRPIDVMRASDQHPGFPALVVLGRFLVLPFVAGESVFSWIWGARAVSGVFGVLVLLAAWRLAHRTFDRRAAIVTAVLVAILPVFRRNAADALSDSPHLFLYLVATSLAVEGLLRRQAKWFAWAGAASGLAFWVRPEGLSAAIVVALFLPLWAWRTKKLRARSVVEFAGIMLLVTALVAAPYLLFSGKFSSKITSKENLYSRSQVPNLPAAVLAEEGRTSPGCGTAETMAPSQRVTGHWSLVTGRPAPRVVLAVDVDKSATPAVPGAEVAPVDKDETVGGRPMTWTVVEAGYRLTGEVAQALCWVLVAPLLAGSFVRDRQKDRGAAHAFILSLVAFHVLLLGWLFWAGGYMNDRHTMAIAVLAMPRIAAGMVLIADRAARRVFTDRDEALAVRRSHWIVAGLVAAAGVVAVPRTLEPLHAAAGPVMKVALELKVYAKPGDQILTNTPYAPFYAQMPGRVITKWDVAASFNLSGVGSPFRFIVFDTDIPPFRQVWLEQIAERYEPLILTGVRAKDVRAFLLRPALPLAPPETPTPRPTPRS